MQEMVALNDPDFPLHVQLLALCVQALKIAEKGHEELPIIFSQAKRNVFLDFLVHQLIDSLYSIFLPAGWAMEIGGRRIIDPLTMLRDALWENDHLLESVSRCLVQDFRCQQWRKSTCNQRAFVSSVVPEEWKAFLDSGICPQKVKGNYYHFSYRAS